MENSFNCMCDVYNVSMEKYGICQKSWKEKQSQAKSNREADKEAAEEAMETRSHMVFSLVVGKLKMDRWMSCKILWNSDSS